ncbi:MAG: hypothetical protein NPIRA02_38970 [Nitrospirales bacterium]|nr:MAG: hypothetical protein NPIRA02_38970 [Nitrospirales bacterium]
MAERLCRDFYYESELQFIADHECALYIMYVFMFLLTHSRSFKLIILFPSSRDVNIRALGSKIASFMSSYISRGVDFFSIDITKNMYDPFLRFTPKQKEHKF